MISIAIFLLTFAWRLNCFNRSIIIYYWSRSFYCKNWKTSGSALIKFKRTWIILLFGALFGFFATLAEPDIQILAGIVCAVNRIPKILFMSIIGLGVGLFTMIAYLRILKNFPLKYLLMCLYALIFIFAFFIPNEFLVLAFDSSGMTTGPITVPFLLALTIGLCSIRNNNKKEDCFGVVAVSSVGSILALEILSRVCLRAISNEENLFFDLFDLKDKERTIFILGINKNQKELVVNKLKLINDKNSILLNFQNERDFMKKEEEEKLIITIITAGFADIVIDMGKQCGETGATTLLGKGVGANYSSFLGVPWIAKKKLF